MGGRYHGNRKKPPIQRLHKLGDDPLSEEGIQEHEVKLKDVWCPSVEDGGVRIQRLLRDEGLSLPPPRQTKPGPLCSASVSAIIHPINGCNCYISCAFITGAAKEPEHGTAVVMGSHPLPLHHCCFTFPSIKMEERRFPN